MEPEQIQEEQTVAPVSKKSFNPMIIGGVIVVFIIILTGFVMLKGNKQNSAQDEAQTQPVQGVESVNETQVGDDRTVEFTANTKTFDIEAASFYYNPKEIRVKLGDTVRINLTAKDLMHDFNIDKFGVKIPITKAGETNTVEFTANALGEFEYYCSVGQHRQNGQVGTLIAEE